MYPSSIPFCHLPPASAIAGAIRPPRIAVLHFGKSWNFIPSSSSVILNRVKFRAYSAAAIVIRSRILLLPAIVAIVQYTMLSFFLLLLLASMGTFLLSRIPTLARCQARLPVIILAIYAACLLALPLMSKYAPMLAAWIIYTIAPDVTGKYAGCGVLYLSAYGTWILYTDAKVNTASYDKLWAIRDNCANI